ncbi:MAG: hypothetical protein DCC75_02160, partial [Proteobacteria bacterium]
RNIMNSSSKQLLYPALFALGALTYLFLLWEDLGRFWFHPHWTTDDALQQVFPFYEVIYPGRFKGDPIYELMLGYLAPLHYWVGAALTWVHQDPIMAAHWVTLIQLALAMTFLFLAVRAASGSSAPAFFALVWFLHTRPVIQRMTGGLPRGWSVPVLCAFVYFFVKNNLLGIHATFLAGCLTHPPATLVAIITYGLYLSVRWLTDRGDYRLRKSLLLLILLGPIYCIITWSVIARPAEVGQMVSYAEALNMPEFSRPSGRFPFVPLEDIGTEFRFFGYQPFFHGLYNPGPLVKRSLPYLIWGALALLVFAGLRSRSAKDTGIKVLVFLAGILVVYLAARVFAFKLYVPNRHLQFPLGVFFIFSFSTLIWLTLSRKTDPDRAIGGARGLVPVLGLLICGAVVYAGSGSGLYGAANFNYSLDKHGGVFKFLKEHTPEDALIAGHPTHIDAVQLFAARRAFATTETAHPFYPGYFAEIKRRLEISLRAHYSDSLQDLTAALLAEGVDYFVFSRKRFYPDALSSEKYFPPFDKLIAELTSKPRESYVYFLFSKNGAHENEPFVVYRDAQSIVIDLKALNLKLLTLNAKDAEYAE